MELLQAPTDLLRTKLYLPRARLDLVRRPRLTARLDAGLRGPLTLLVAPAGFGKTTLLVDWRAAVLDDPEGRAWPVAWLALDAGDNDLVRFLRYLVAALQTAWADFGRGIVALLSEPQPPVETLLTSLLNELATRDADLVLVLDDYHLIDEPAIHQAMTFLLDHLPPCLHLVIASRVDPPLPLARLRARGQLSELRAAELRFDTGEAEALLRQALGEPLAADEVTRLEARTEGWIAGLQLAALALQGRDEGERSRAIDALAGTHRYILDYLADEVFERQPTEVRRFLLRTALLERLCGPLCDALLEEPGRPEQFSDGQAMLERLEAASLFLIPLDHERVWFRYHHLFADFLRARLRREEPALIPELHRRASRWFEQAGQWAEAAEHALAAGDAVEAARLIEPVTPILLFQRGELTILQRWLARLPGEIVRGRPRLCLDLAWAALLAGRLDAVTPLLADAERALSDMADDTEAARALRGAMAAMRAELARLDGRSAAAVELARRALADLPPEARRERAAAAAFLGSAQLSRCHAAGSIEAYAQAFTLTQTPGAITLALFAGGRLILAQALGGRLRQAAATYRWTLELAGRYGMAQAVALGAAEVAMAEVLRERNDLDGAEELLGRGIARCREANGMAQMALEGALTLARLRQAQGDPAGARAALDAAEPHARDHRVAQYAERLAIARARLWLTSAPQEEAQLPDQEIASALTRWDGEFEAPSDGSDEAHERGDYVDLLGRLALAHLRLAQGRRVEATSILPPLLERAEAGSLTGHAIEILALQARLAQDAGDEAQAMICFSRALALGEPEGYRRVFLDEGAAIARLLRTAEARGVAPAYVARLLAACGDAAPEASPCAAALLDPLSERELELLGLVAAGLSTGEIATRLFISPETVRTHLKNIYGKLDVHSRLQAVERARALRLI